MPKSKGGPKPKCLIPKCSKDAVGRGLCKRCHNAAMTAVRRRETNWAELEELGLAIPPFSDGVFRKALLEAREKRKRLEPE